MILPIFAYGQPVLTKIASQISADYPDLEFLIQNMWETMYNAHGVGLAAPQVGHSIRLFVVDTIQIKEKGDKGDKEPTGIKKVFINAVKIDETGEPWNYEEGCLSIPAIRGEVSRLPVVKLRYMDENFVEKTELFSGINARVIQHEFDHTEGVLFTEKLSPAKKSLIRNKLENIKKGKVNADYKMKFPNK